MENSNQNNEQVSYEVVNDSENDNNIIILMENSNQDNESVGKKVDNDSPNEKMRKSKIKKISSPKKGNQNGDGSMSPRKSPKKGHQNEDGSISPRKKDGTNRRFQRKNAKKNIVQKKKRGGEEIKVVGKVSAKLSSLIERLQQNTISSQNKVNTQFEGDKVVMAPRIKAALEKFNKKKTGTTTNYSYW